MTNERGLVFDIRRFSTHDGPGIRTTVFTKGCPLRCLWCQNPEGLEQKRRLVYAPNLCIGCGSCIAACPTGAISWTGQTNKIKINSTLCDLNGRCVDVCPPAALNVDSREMSVEEVVGEVLQDRSFFRESGGVTISGGDPVAQAEFNIAILKACRAEGIHTAIETSLYADPAVIDRFLPHLDLLIADFKVLDPEQHRAWTGVDNKQILQNLDEVFTNWFNPGRLDLLIRIPLIPGHTATTENIRSIGLYCQSRAPGVKIELLNYNPLAKSKYSQLGQPFLFDENPPLYSNEEMAQFNQILLDLGIAVVFEGPLNADAIRK